MQLEERIKFEEWLKQNNWVWVVGMTVFINDKNEKKSYKQIFDLYNSTK